MRLKLVSGNVFCSCTIWHCDGMWIGGCKLNCYEQQNGYETVQRDQAYEKRNSLSRRVSDCARWWAHMSVCVVNAGWMMHIARCRCWPEAAI